MKRDEKIFDLIRQEKERQMHGIELIASENFGEVNGIIGKSTIRPIMYSLSLMLSSGSQYLQ